MTTTDVIALADRDSVCVPPLSQAQADYTAALLASARSHQAAA